MSDFTHQTIGRRPFLQGTTLLLTASGTSLLSAAESQPALRVGLITDLHYADKAPAGTRYYRETLSKLAEASDKLGAEKPALVIELGDLIDAANDVEVELGYLKTINDQFQKLSDDRHYVLGNHCVDTLTKGEFLGAVGQAKSYYSFDRGGFHFVLLDACFKSDGQPYQRKNFEWTDANIPAEELKWLASDLAATDKPTIVLAHQRLDNAGNHMVRNSAAVRDVLEKSGKVTAVFQGHNHKNSYQQIGGIHYCTLVAMIEGSGAENNAYSILDLLPDGSLRLSGFRKQASYNWNAPA